MAKTRLPRVLNETTCMITLSASITKTPPTITRTISCLISIATIAIEPPSARLPVSPMKMRAG